MKTFNFCLLIAAFVTMIYSIVTFGYSAQHMDACSNKLGVELVGMAAALIASSVYVGYRSYKEESLTYSYVDIALSLFLLGINIWGTILYRETNVLLCDGSIYDLGVTTTILVWLVVGGPLAVFLFEKFKVKCIYVGTKITSNSPTTV